MGKVLDFDAVRDSDPNEIVFTAAGPIEQMAEAAIATLQTATDQKEIEQAIAMLTFMGAKLDELDSLGVEI